MNKFYLVLVMFASIGILMAGYSYLNDVDAQAICEQSKHSFDACFQILNR